MHIGRLLTGILQQQLQPCEIIIVDSGSTDATLTIASRFPVTILHIPAEQFSFGRSLNLGIEAANGGIVAIVSAHVYPISKDWLTKLVDPLADERVALVYGKQRGDGNTKFSEHQIFTAWFGEQSDLHQSSPFCNNANAAIRRSVWDQVRYDESLTGLEDLDWAARVIKDGYRIAYSATAAVRHVHNESWERIYHRYRREAIALKTIRPEEQFDLADFLKLFAVSVFSDVRQVLRAGRLIFSVHSIVLFRFSQYFGTYMGFRQKGMVSTEMKRKFYFPAAMTEKTNESRGYDTAEPVDYSGSQQGLHGYPPKH
jgi:glycosyltransferase involved in cell wall biosynthesis